MKSLLFFSLILVASNLSAATGHRLITQGNGKLAIVEKDGEISWEMKWGGIHDIHVLKNGHIMVQQNMKKVVEIDPKTKEIVWSYDSAASEDNKGKRIEVHAFQPLENGNVMIAESGAGRIIEVNREGAIVKQIKLKLDKPNAHSDTRLARPIRRALPLRAPRRPWARAGAAPR